MTVVDIIIIVVLLVYIAKGFIQGVLKEFVSFVGGLAIIIIAYLLKNPVSVYMYKNLPFFNFSGYASGISVLNIIVYELVAFLAVSTLLIIIYQILLKLTNVLEFILKITFILEIPSKILGAILGFVEGVIMTFIILFICMQFDYTRSYIDNSKNAHKILSETPILSKAIEPVYESLQEIYTVIDNYKEAEDKNAANLESLNILLKYKVIDVTNAQMLLDNNKLNIDGADELIDSYRKKE